jgi:lysophospholipase L1-like esterase
MKIVAVGDSITYGWGGSSRVTPYTTYLNNLIPNDTVVNNGENGNKTSDIVNYFPTRVIAENPGMVIILAGINDIFYYVPVATMESNLETAYNLAITNNITPVCCTLLACSNLNSDYNPSVGSEQLGMALALNNWIRNYALTHNLTVIDFYSATQDPTNPNHLIPSITDDGTHPNERGYELMGNIVYDTLFNTRVMSLTEHGFNSTPFGRDNILTMASGDSVCQLVSTEPF